MALVALAVAQPVLDVLGRAPEFFVARGAPALDVVLLGMLLAIGVPLLVAGLVAAAWALKPAAGRAVHAVVLAGCGAVLAAELVERTWVAGWPLWARLVPCFGAGVGLVLAFRRWPGLRTVLRYAALGPAVVLATFLVLAPVSRLVWGEAGQALAAAPAAAPASVVVLVFDEFPVASLIDPSGALRADQFPAFARLAADGTWFRNAVGVHERTEEALPSILSGRLAPLDENIPAVVDYPDNLFTLLGGTYRLAATESVTALCPPAVCVGGSRPTVPFADRWRSLGSDLAVVTGHVLLPPEMAEGLPSIEQGWGGFTSDRDPGDWELNRRFNEAVEADRRVGIDGFLDGLEDPLGDGELRFAHLLLPHAPWDLLPDGRTYRLVRQPPGEWTPWPDDPWAAELAYQRHLLQVQYVDSVIGEVIGRLEASGSYDDALIVVVADHGVTIRPGMERRIVTAETVGDVAAVPLFVKRPGPPRGDISDYRAETTDILPTIAAVLGVEVPWRTTGVDLFGPDLPERTTSTMHSSYGSVTFGVDGAEKLAVAAYHDTFFDGGDPFRMAPPGFRHLLGTSAGAADPAEGVEARLDQAFPAVEEEGVAAVVVSGRLSGVDPGEHVVAVAVGGEVVAVTRTWPDGAGSAFSALVPPGALDDVATPELYLVEGGRLALVGR